MPAYYWIQLYKDPDELDIRRLVEYSVEGLMEAGCVYQSARITTIEDDSLPEMKQVVLDTEERLEIEEAKRRTVNDIETWQTVNRQRKWLPGITLIFAFDFRFDPKIKAKLLKRNELEKVRQVTLRFWLQEDSLLRKDIITVDIDTWEEYVLDGGKFETNKHNKHAIINMIGQVCARICPHFGWTDVESCSDDMSYSELENGQLPVDNDYVVIGPQLLDRIPKETLENTPHLYKRLDNGVVILHGNENPARQWHGCSLS